MEVKSNHKSPRRRMKVETDKDGYALCPKCGAKTGLKLYPDDALEDYPLWCKTCRRTTHTDRPATSIIDATCTMMERLKPRSRRMIYDLARDILKGQGAAV